MTSNLPPQWFMQAIAARPRHDSIHVDGSSVAFRTWGTKNGPGLLLIHGSGAHSGWWDHIAGQLAQDFQIVAIDLTGHGDSAHRSAYDVDHWVSEVLAVAESAQLAEPFAIVGHSMGAYVALRTAAISPQRVRAVLAVDPPVREISPEMLQDRAKLVASKPRVYESFDEAAARWRPAPRQDALEFVRDHIAAQSVREVPGGWGWKFDQTTFDRLDIAPHDWERLDCTVDVLRAQNGMLAADMAELLISRLGPLSRDIIVADAGHHMMLDHPEAIVDAIAPLLRRADSSLTHNNSDGDLA